MIYKIICSVTILITLLACRKYPVDVPQADNNSLDSGIWILNEGLFQQNNSSLSYYRYSSNSVGGDYFQQIAGRPLGDTGNDMAAYGDKIYIVVNVSSSLEVIDRITGKHLKQIPMFSSSGQAKQPRFITFQDGYAFVSCYDGYVDVIDTANLNVLKRVKVGSNPDHILAHNNRVYVSNSGGLNFPNLDSTISVIDVSTLSETERWTVGPNPGKIISTANSDLFVVVRGNFSNIPTQLKKISPDGEILSNHLNVSSIVKIESQYLWVKNISGSAIIQKFDGFNVPPLSDEWIPTQNFETLYQIQFAQKSKTVFVLDANSYVNTGIAYQYDLNGQLLRSFSTGLIPTCIYEIY